MLFSREFLEAARDRLTPGGVYLQWFHTNGLQGDPAEPTAMALRTFAAVFPAVAVWYGSGTELLIVGMKDDRDALDLDRIERLSLRTDIAAGLRARGDPRSRRADRARAAAASASSTRRRLPGPIHTLLHPQLGNLAARAAFSGAEAALPPTADLETARVGQRNSLQRRFAARFGGRLPESARGNLVGAALPPPAPRMPDAARRLDPRRSRIADAGDRAARRSATGRREGSIRLGFRRCCRSSASPRRRIYP